MLSSAVFSQETTDLGTFKMPKNFNQAHDTYIHDSQVILNYSPYIPVTNLSLVKFGFYQYAPLKSGAEFTEKRIQAEEGIVQQCYYSGDTITEYLIYYKKGFPKYQCRYAIRRRSCTTMGAIGEEKTLATHEFTDVSDYRHMRLQYNGSDFAFVEMSKTGGSVTFLSDDLNETNKIALTEQSLSSVETKQFYLGKLNTDGSVLLIFPNSSKGALNSIKNTILHLDPSGEIHSFVTDFTTTDIQAISYGSYEYEPKNKEISWIYSIGSNTKPEQNGFGIAKWNLDGDLIANTNTFLNFETIFKNEPEIQDWFKSKKVSTEEIWGKYGRYGFFSRLRSGDDLYITISNPTVSPELVSALYICKIDNEGNMIWITPILTSFQMPYFYSGTPYLKDGKIHVLLADLTVNMERNKHVNKFFAKTDGEITFFDITLNPQDGSEESNDRLDITLGTDKKLTSVSLNEKESKAFLEIQSGKTINYKEINLK